MTIRYSYDDFTTKGHGVIEGDFYSGTLSGKKKKKSKVSKKDEKKNDIQSSYNNLMKIHEAAEAERRAKAYIQQHDSTPKKSKNL